MECGLWIFHVRDPCQNEQTYEADFGSLVRSFHKGSDMTSDMTSMQIIQGVIISYFCTDMTSDNFSGILGSDKWYSSM